LWLWPWRQGEGGDNGECGEHERPGEGLPERRRSAVGGGVVLQDEGEHDDAEHPAELLQDAVGAGRRRHLFRRQAPVGHGERGQLDCPLAAKWIIRGVTTPEIAALHRLTIAELTHHPELQRSWRDDKRGRSITDAITAYLAACDRRGTLTVPDPATAARQFVLLASTEAQVRSLRGIEPLSSRAVNDIARDTATLIVRAHQIT
jgi:hypothetical protein